MTRNQWIRVARTLVCAIVIFVSFSSNGGAYAAEDANTSFPLPQHIDSDYCSQDVPINTSAANHSIIAEQTTFSIVCEQWAELDDNGWMNNLRAPDGQAYKAFFVQGHPNCAITSVVPTIDRMLDNTTAIGDGAITEHLFGVSTSGGELLFLNGYFATNIDPRLSDADIRELAHRITELIRDSIICP